MRHKHGVTDSFGGRTGFDTTRASSAHSEIAETQARLDKASEDSTSGGGLFAVGESVLARRRLVPKGGESWDKAKMLDGWHPAEVVKVRKAGTPDALYSVR